MDDDDARFMDLAGFGDDGVDVLDRWGQASKRFVGMHDLGADYVAEVGEDSTDEEIPEGLDDAKMNASRMLAQLGRIIAKGEDDARIFFEEAQRLTSIAQGIVAQAERDALWYRRQLTIFGEWMWRAHKIATVKLPAGVVSSKKQQSKAEVDEKAAEAWLWSLDADSLPSWATVKVTRTPDKNKLKAAAKAGHLIRRGGRYVHAATAEVLPWLTITAPTDLDRDVTIKPN